MDSMMSATGKGGDLLMRVSPGVDAPGHGKVLRQARYS